jgi:hypothetical protein
MLGVLETTTADHLMKQAMIDEAIDFVKTIR